ncbi:GTPase [Aureococcus anophagefferens]|nr:GTPase [Aureococcus anophagefferens]
MLPTLGSPACPPAATPETDAEEDEDDDGGAPLRERGRSLEALPPAATADRSWEATGVAGPGRVEREDALPGRAVALVFREALVAAGHWTSPDVDLGALRAACRLAARDGAVRLAVESHLSADRAAVVLRGAARGLRAGVARCLAAARRPRNGATTTVPADAWYALLEAANDLRGLAARVLDDEALALSLHPHFVEYAVAELVGPDFASEIKALAGADCRVPDSWLDRLPGGVLDGDAVLRLAARARDDGALAFARALERGAACACERARRRGPPRQRRAGATLDALARDGNLAVEIAANLAPWPRERCRRGKGQALELGLRYYDFKERRPAAAPLLAYALVDAEAPAADVDEDRGAAARGSDLAARRAEDEIDRLRAGSTSGASASRASRGSAASRPTPTPRPSPRPSARATGSCNEVALDYADVYDLGGAAVACRDLREVVEDVLRTARESPPARRGTPHTVVVARRHARACGTDPTRRGFLGQGPVFRVHRPARVPAGGLRFISVATHSFHTLALTASGEVYSFGHGGCGQLGHGDQESSATPRRVDALAGAFSPAASTTPWPSTAGACYSWGAGEGRERTSVMVGGFLGHRSLDDAARPRRVEGLAGVRAVACAAGALHSLVLSAAGDVYSFGHGGGGRLGHGDSAMRWVPERVAALAGVAAIAAGDAHSACAPRRHGLHLGLRRRRLRRTP